MHKFEPCTQLVNRFSRVTLDPGNQLLKEKMVTFF